VTRQHARGSGKSNPMSNVFYNLVPFAIAAVAIVLVLGLYNMMRGGSPSTSQTLMRMRVLLQFVAVVLIMGALWIMGR
jgi:heme/copper-type cytochrome/quinol oxidase subunit 4